MAEEKVMLFRHNTSKGLEDESAQHSIGEGELSFVSDSEETLSIDAAHYVRNAPYNSGLAVKQHLTPRQLRKELKKNRKFPEEGGDLVATKFRIKDGGLQIFVRDDSEDDATNGFWFFPRENPTVSDAITTYVSENLRIVGSSKRIFD